MDERLGTLSRPLLLEPWRRRVILLAVATLAYAAVFLPLRARVGTVAIITSLAPVITAGTLFGIKGGLLCALGVHALTVGLLALLPGPLPDDWLLSGHGGPVGLPLSLVVGALTGRFRLLHLRLKAEQDRYRALVENANETIVVVQDGVICYANPKAEELTGYRRDEIVGSAYERFLDERDRAEIARLVERSSRREVVARRITCRITDRAGYTRWISVRPAQITWDDRPALLAMIDEITEARQAQLALQDSEERFRVISERGLAGVYIIQDGHIHYANPALAQMLGYQPDELIGRPVLDFVHPDDRELVAQKLAKRLSGEEEEAHYVLRAVRKDGEERYLEVLGRRVIHHDRPAIIGTIIDVTERQKAEEQLRRANAMLEAAVRARDEMIQNVSHELRTPLTVIRGYVDLLKDGMAGELSDMQREIVELLDQHSHRLQYMINRMITLQTLTDTPIHRERLDVSSLVSRVTAAWQAEARERGIFLWWEIPERTFILADGDLIQQLLGNIIDNAIKFSPGGGEVRISARLTGEHLQIAVSDQGIGLLPEDLERIFEPFYQVDGSTTRRFGGMGIGLTLCRRIVELHGGRIWAESAGPGQGSTFYIELPMFPEAIEELEPARAEAGMM
ncbi:MAG: hypothetical protein Kow0047_33530 [Anaerolineae bacterium]